MSKTYIHFLFIIILFSACENQLADSQSQKRDDRELSQSLIKANRYLIRAEEEDINDFIRRRKWQMQTTGTGLRYAITSEEKGPTAQYGQLITLKYKVLFLTGDVVYDSDELGLKQFIVGRGGVETGLEEGIRMLRKGDKAKFILPSHLAFGLLGDSYKIPPRTPIVYIIEVIDIQSI